MTNQRTFAAGEVSPSLYGRDDVDRWKSALHTCRNFIVMPEGGITARPGFEVAADVFLGDMDNARLIPFEFGPDDSYVMVMYDNTMRVIRNGAIVEEDGGGNYTLGVTINAPTIRWVQSGDTLYLADGINRPQRLVREALGWEVADVTRHDNWTISEAPVTPAIPTGVTVTLTGGSGTQASRYRITYTDRDGLESAACRTAAVTGTATLSGGLWQITSAAHLLESNDTVEITEDKLDDAGTLVYRNGDLVRVVKTAANTFTVAGNTLAVSGNFKYRKLGDSILATATAAAPVTATWTLVPNAEFYNVYREYGRFFSYIGSTSGASFKDYGIVPDAKDNPIVGIDPMRSEDGGDFDNVPSAVGLFQQRLFFGGFVEDTERIVCSAVGNYSAFDPSAEDASGVDFELAGRSVSNVRHMVEIAGRAVILTSTAEWVIKGGSGGGITPTAINARADSFNGCSDVPPVVVGNNLLFVQRGGRILRDAQYDYAQESLTSRDLSLWSKHLFNSDIRRIAYQRSEQVIWCLLENGTLLGLTYIPEQDVWGWHRHDIEAGGSADPVTLMDITVVSEGNRDRLYAMGIYQGGGLGVVMRMALVDSNITDVKDFIGLDAAKVYDGRYGNQGTLTGGTNWTTSESLTLQVTGAGWVIGVVGSSFMMYSGEEMVRLVCTAWVNGTTITVTPVTVVPVAIRGVPCDTALCASSIATTDAWFGRTLGVVADGGREANVVYNGPLFSNTPIALSTPAGRYVVGIPMTCRAKTLEVESTDKDTLMGDFRHVTRVRVRCVRSRGVMIGDSESTLEDIVPTYTVLGNAPPSLEDGVKEVVMSATHDEAGSVIIAQDDGMPTTITNIRALFNTGEQA